MGVPAYYLDSDSPIDAVELPRAPRADSKLYARTDDAIHLETGRGVSWDYGQFTRKTPTYIFRVSTTQLQVFITMHNAVVEGGERKAFHFIRDVDATPLDVIHCRKQLSFDPQPIGRFMFNGVYEQWWDVTLELEEEITAADVAD